MTFNNRADDALRHRILRQFTAIGTVTQPTTNSAIFADADKKVSESRQRRPAALLLALYVATLSIDAIRKTATLPSSTVAVIYAITILIYIISIPRATGSSKGTRSSLPVWLALLSLWCLAVALIQRTPAEMALLGWTSYVFFVPLSYIGAEISADDKMTARALRIVAIGGAAVGVNVLISAGLGNSAPVFLQPITTSVGIHTFDSNNIYLAPSFFATAEEASEQLLISLFSWIALAHLDSGRFQRIPSAMIGALIIGGLLFTARRADIYVAIAGIIAVLILGRIQGSASTRYHASCGSVRTQGKLGWTMFIAAIGSAALIFLLGGSTLRSFLVSGSAGGRISFMFSLPSSGSLIGQGPGTSTQGTTALTGGTAIFSTLTSSTSSYVVDGRTFIATEGSLGKTWLELGIMGVALYGAVFLTALFPAIRSLRRMDGVGIALTTLAIALGVIFLKGHQSLDNPLIQPLFWLAVGGAWGRLQALPSVACRHPRARRGQSPKHASSLYVSD